MLRSMFSAISGLRAHQTKMDVTGNNIANVNTVGFKSSQTVFQDALSQIIRAGGAPAADRGGTNPAQVGLGARVAAITTNWTQGAQQTTGRSTDFMIEGDGFFVTQSGTEQLYTRAGSFDFDGAGRLVTPDGALLQGWLADANGAIDVNAPIAPLSVPFGQTIAPAATTNGVLTGNLSAQATATPPETVSTAITMYDGAGVAYQVSLAFTKAAAGWDLSVTTEGNPTPVYTAAGLTTFGNITVDPGWGNVNIDLTGLTQYGGKSTLSAVTPPTGGGSAAGTLQSFSLGNDGTITGSYSNGLRETLGRLALASFNNPGGLEKAGSSSFRVGDNSGAAQVGMAGIGGRGELVSGALEMSNVDLAEEFTGLIVAQRGFQANSRVITSSDEILQDLVNLKR